MNRPATEASGSARRTIRRVLLAAWYFPPCGWGGAQRPAKWSRYLPEFGWDPVVLSVDGVEWPVRDDSLLRELPAELRVLRDRPAATVPGIGDEGLRWLLPLVRRAREELRRGPIDALLLTGSPFFSFLAGPILRVAQGLPYVLDFRDPWTVEPWWPEPPTWKGRSKMAAAMLAEAVAVRRAAACTFAQPGVAKAYRRAYPELRPPGGGTAAVVLPNGYDDADFPYAGRPPEPAPSRQRYRIVHAGSWVSDRTPELILDALALLRRNHPRWKDRIEAVFAGLSTVGGPRWAAERGLEQVVRFEAYRPHDEAVRLVRDADLLWLDTGVHREFVAGKTFEYLASGRPVLAAVHPEGPAAAWLREAGTGTVVPRDPAAVADALASLLRDLEQGRSPDPNAAAVERFSRRRLTGRLARVLDDVAQPGGRGSVPMT